MDANCLTFVAKTPTLINIGENAKDFHTGCSVLDVTFPHAYFVQVGDIHFRNYYTHWLKLKARFQDKTKVSGEGKWKTCIRRVELMPHAHCDLASEQYFTISQKQMLFPLDSIIGLRFILYQPSPLWREFRIDNIQIQKKPQENTESSTLAHNLHSLMSSGKSKAEQLTMGSLSTVSQHMQQLWALSQQSTAAQNTQKFGRFDVDGNYDLNLLSYN